MMVGKKREKLYSQGQHMLRSVAETMCTYVEGNQKEEPDETAKPKLRCSECHFHPMPVKVFLIHIARISSAMVV